MTNPPNGLQQSHSLWRAVGKLLRLRLQIGWGGFKRASWKGKLGYFMIGLLGVGLLGFAFYLSRVVLSFLRSAELFAFLGDLEALLTSLPTMLITAAFFGILMTSFGLLLQALYLAGDMDFLLSAPIPIRAVFIAKLLQAILPNFALILVFGLPVLFGLGAAEGYQWLYYPMVVVMLAVAALAAAGVSSLLVMGIVRVFPARRVAEVLGLVVGLSIFTCSQSGQFTNYAQFSSDQIARVVGVMERVDQPWSPLAWAGRGIVAVGHGEWLTATAWLVPVLLLMGMIFTFSLVTAERLYYSGWSNLQNQIRKKRSHQETTTQRRGVGAYLRAQLELLVPPPVRAVVVKDALVIRRDLRNLSQLFFPLILGVVYTAMLLGEGRMQTNPPPEMPGLTELALQNLVSYANVGIALFVSWSLLTRLGMMSFSQEGRSYWILKSAPVSVGQLLTAKFLVAYLPAVLMSLIFLVVIGIIRRCSLDVFGFGLGVVMFSIAGMTGIMLAFGVRGAIFDWDDPRNMYRGGIGCLATLLNVIFLLPVLGLFFGPAIVLSYLGLEWLGQVIGLVMGSAACLAGALIPLWMVRTKVPDLMEE